MAAFFTGVVRAPITGIVLATEMTGSVSMLLPMLCACSMAMLAATLLKDPPIYEFASERALPVDKPIATARERRTIQSSYSAAVAVDCFARPQ